VEAMNITQLEGPTVRELDPKKVLGAETRTVRLFEVTWPDGRWRLVYDDGPRRPMYGAEGAECEAVKIVETYLLRGNKQ
jgi:hypothetical protein